MNLPSVNSIVRNNFPSFFLTSLRSGSDTTYQEPLSASKSQEMTNVKTKFEIKKELEKLKTNLQTKGWLKGIAIAINAIAGIIIGAYLRNIPLVEGDMGNNFLWIVIFIFLCGVFIFLNFWIFYSDNSDKIEFVDRLIYKEELDYQTILNKVLLDGLFEVNEQTCSTFQCEDPCSEEKFIGRLKKITEPLRKFIKSELESDVAINIYLDGFIYAEENQIKTSKRIFHLFDELETQSEIPIELMDGDLRDKKGFHKLLFKEITDVTYDENYELSFITSSDKNERPNKINDYFFNIFSYIPDLCTKKDPICEGCIFIVTNSTEQIDKDLTTFFKLYGWFIGSYIDQYNQCVNSRITS